MTYISKFSGVFLTAALIGFWGCSKSDTPGDTAAKDGAAATNPATASIGGTPGKSTEDALRPVVIMETSMGPITIQLNAEKAPQTVSNFLRYVDGGFYDQTIFHQVFKDQGILGGGYGVDLTEKEASLQVRNEAHNGLKNRRGTLAMVRAADVIDSARSQFFFNLVDNDSLDFRERTPDGYGYCVFGEVTNGLDVLDRIAAVPVKDLTTPSLLSTPVQPIIIKSVRRSR